MKRIFILLFFLLTAVLPVRAQVALQSYSLTATGAQPAVSLLTAPVDKHVLMWKPSGTVTTCTVALDTSPDNSAWSAGGAIAGQTCTSAGEFTSAVVNANYVRVNLTTLTGGGTLTIVYAGVNSAGGTSISGTVTANAGTGQFNVTCTAANCPINAAQWGGTNLGTPTNFGTTPGAVVAGSDNASLFMGTTAARSNQTTTAAGVVDVNVVGSLGVTNSATNGTFARLTDNTTAVGVIAGTNALKEDVSSVAGTATATAAAGVQKVGVVGNANATLDSTAAAGAAPTNGLLTTGIYNTTIPAPTAGQALAQQSDATGSQYVNVEGRKTTYHAATTASFAPTNTIIGTLFGSASKTIRVTHIWYSYSTTGAIAAGQLLQTMIIKRSTADSAGTCTTLTQIPTDSNFAAGTATFVNSCTANPTTGTLVGTYTSVQCLVTNDTGTVDTLGDCKGDLLNPFSPGYPGGATELVLRGTAQGIEIQVSAAIPATSQAQLVYEWTEE